jgi:hypothetical protein
LEEFLFVRHNNFASAMADMKYVYLVAFDREQDTVNVRLSSVEQLTYFKRKARIFWGDWTPLGVLGQ